MSHLVLFRSLFLDMILLKFIFHQEDYLGSLPDLVLAVDRPESAAAARLEGLVASAVDRIFRLTKGWATGSWREPGEAIRAVFVDAEDRLRAEVMSPRAREQRVGP